MVGKIYLKELKDTFRDQKTLFLSVLIPVFMIAGLTLFYENMFFENDQLEVNEIGVSVGIDAEWFDRLNQVDNIELIKVADPREAAVNGEVRAGLVMEGNVQENLDTGKTLDIIVYADQSSNRSSEAVSDLTLAIDALQQEVVSERLTLLGIDVKQIKPFEVKIEPLSREEEGSIMLLSMLSSLVIVMSVMLGGFPAATDLFAGEKERKTMEALLITPVSRLKLILAKWLTISTLGTVSGVFSILAFVLVTLTLTENMAQALNFGRQTWLIFLSAVVGIAAFSFMFATIQMMISIIAKSFKEAQNYLSPVMFLALIPYFLLVGIIPNELTMKHYLIPFMNIFALLKELIYGIFSVQSMLMVAGSSAVVIIIGFIIANWMFTKDKWVLGK